MVIIKEEKLNKVPTSFNTVKAEVSAAEYDDYHKHLIDETKKKAIYTARTYDDFKDAVKGCTLKPISSREFNAPPKMRYNWHAGNSSSQKKEATVKRGTLDSKSVAVSSGAAFERGFRRAKEAERLAFLQSVPLEKYPDLFKVELDADLFSAILEVAASDVVDAEPTQWARDWLVAVEQLPSAALLAAFLTKEDKERVQALSVGRTSAFL
jgi:hypothetical protein